MKASEPVSIRDRIFRRLERGGKIIIRYKDDPDHTVKERIKDIVHGIQAASKDDCFGALMGMVANGEVERRLEEREQTAYGSQPDPKVTSYKAVVFELRAK